MGPMSELRREIFGWHSPHLGMHMPIVRYGHWGPAVLHFPTAGGDFLEAERMGLIGAIRHHLEAGRLTLFSIDSINPHAWLNGAVDFPEKSRRQAAYSQYIENEVVPHVRCVLQNDSARLLTSGASFGAFHAANALFRRPELFFGLLGMSGLYELNWFLHGFNDETVYFNSPNWFVPNLQEGDQLNRLRNDARILLFTSRGAYEHTELTETFSRTLSAKQIPHHMEIWGSDMPHDWPTWFRMFDLAISQHLRW